MKNKRQKTDGCWHSSTGISPRPMLMGAAHDALRASNARVSLTCLYVIARRVPRPLCGQVGIARSRRGGHGALAVWLDTGQNVSVCLILRRRPPAGLSFSKCSLSPGETENRERVSCFRCRGRFGQFMLTIEWMSLISSRRFMYSSTRTRGWPSGS